MRLFFNTLVPDAPGSFTVSEVYSDALRVSWDRPLRVNGVLLAYLLKHWRNDTSPSNAHTTPLPNDTLSYTVTGLSANTIYSVELSAQTRAGIGTSKKLSAMTTQSPGKITWQISPFLFVVCLKLIKCHCSMCFKYWKTNELTNKKLIKIKTILACNVNLIQHVQNGVAREPFF